MQKSNAGGGSGKRGGAADRQARLAAKLRQNLVRRKDKTRAAALGASMRIDAATPQARSTAPDDGDKGI